MKSDVMGTGTPVSKNDLKELLKETKETLAENVTVANNRSFGVVDLWHVQKQQRTSASMMRRWLN
jgi:hypothetical protein